MRSHGRRICFPIGEPFSDICPLIIPPHPISNFRCSAAGGTGDTRDVGGEDEWLHLRREHESRKSVNDALKMDAVMRQDRKVCIGFIINCSKIMGDGVWHSCVCYIDRVLIKIVATSDSHLFDQSHVIQRRKF